MTDGPRRWTRDEYHRMAELGLLDPNERVELVGGEVWYTSPQRRPHFRAIRAVTDALEDVFGPGFDVQQQAALILTDNSEPEPDVAVVRGSWADYADHPTAADVLIVVEVSDGTIAKDRSRKAATTPAPASPTAGSSTS